MPGVSECFIALLFLGGGWLQEGFSEIRIAILMQGSDFINISVVPSFDVNQFDLGDVFISPCRAGTYNEARDSFCKDCSVCAVYQYERGECISTRNRECVNCTVCTDREQELCGCTQRTPECVTGDRVCLPLPPTSANITFDLTVSTKLSALKERFLQEGLRTGFILFLGDYLHHDQDLIVMTLLDKRSPTSYVVTFIVSGVYSLFTKLQVSRMDRVVVQEGLTSTFGVQSNTFSTVSQQRRRLLQAGAVTLSAANVDAQCVSQGACERFFVMENPDTPCDSTCVSVPCPVGYTGFYGLCTLCPNATFKSVPGNDSCVDCPVGHFSNQGSENASQCWMPSTTVVFSSSSTPRPTSSTTVQAVRTNSSTGRPFASTASSVGVGTTSVGIASSVGGGQASASISSSQGLLTIPSTPLPWVSDTTHVISIAGVTSALLTLPPVSGVTSDPREPVGVWGPIFNVTLINNYYFSSWNTGRAGTVQYITVNETRDEWVLGTVILLMVVGILALAAIGTRILLVIRRPPAHAGGYERLPIIPLPIQQPRPPPEPISPPLSPSHGEGSVSVSSDSDGESSPPPAAPVRRRVHIPRAVVWKPDVFVGEQWWSA